MAEHYRFILFTGTAAVAAIVYWSNIVEVAGSARRGVHGFSNAIEQMRGYSEKVDAQRLQIEALHKLVRDVRDAQRRGERGRAMGECGGSKWPL